MSRFETLARLHRVTASVLVGVAASVPCALIAGATDQPVQRAAMVGLIGGALMLYLTLGARATAAQFEADDDDDDGPRPPERRGLRRRLMDAFRGRVGPYRDADAPPRDEDDHPLPDLDIWRLGR